MNHEMAARPAVLTYGHSRYKDLSKPGAYRSLLRFVAKEALVVLATAAALVVILTLFLLAI